MPSGKSVVAVVIAAAIASVLLGPITGAVTTNTGTVDVTNESVTADLGNATDLDGYNIDNSSETVYWLNSTSGQYEEVTDGTDYSIDPGPGTITALQGGTIGDGDQLKVSYSYQATDDTTTPILALIPLLFALLLLVTVAKPLMGAI